VASAERDGPISAHGGRMRIGPTADPYRAQSPCLHGTAKPYPAVNATISTYVRISMAMGPDSTPSSFKVPKANMADTISP